MLNEDHPGHGHTLEHVLFPYSFVDSWRGGIYIYIFIYLYVYIMLLCMGKASAVLGMTFLSRIIALSGCITVSRLYIYDIEISGSCVRQCF
jgi:hypothetical protein